jgi:hypothetical protein
VVFVQHLKNLIPFGFKEFKSSKEEEIPCDFQTLIAEIVKPSNSYILKTANRIYGERTYPFHNVSVNVLC